MTIARLPSPKKFSFFSSPANISCNAHTAVGITQAVLAFMFHTDSIDRDKDNKIRFSLHLFIYIPIIRDFALFFRFFSVCVMECKNIFLKRLFFWPGQRLVKKCILVLQALLLQDPLSAFYRQL